MIIKNCPAFIDFDEQSLFESLCSKYGGMCEKHKNCIMKLITNKQMKQWLQAESEG